MLWPHDPQVSKTFGARRRAGDGGGGMFAEEGRVTVKGATGQARWTLYE